MDSETLRRLQRKNDFTNPELAARMGVSKSLVEKWRGGQRKITMHMAIMLEMVLGKPITRRSTDGQQSDNN